MRWRLVVGPVLAIALAASPAKGQSSYDELSRFSAVLRHISDNHADSVTYKSLVRSAIDGMLRSLDPHSWFLPAEDADKYDALERGELAVTGIEIELADDVPIVIAVAKGSSAASADVRAGDRVMTVDGEPTAGLTGKLVALRLAGARGTRVRVVLERGSRLEPDSVTVTLRREPPKQEPSVLRAQMVADSTGLVQLGQFGPKSADELRKAIRSLRGDGMRQLILDLRGNPGGIVTEAVAMAARFLPANTLVFTTRGRQRTATQEYRTSGGGEFRELPLVVLIDEHSASASEALAASLQDHDRAVIAGRRSFGKALMQTGFLVPNGYVQLTIGHVIAPSGRFIQRPYQGLAIEQYRAFAGDSTRQDTTTVFHTAAGRAVRGGGGVAPDVALPAPPSLPRWFTVAADSGWTRAVADSVAFTLGTSQADRRAWQHDTAAWRVALVEPMLARVRARLGVTGRSDPPLEALLGQRLAARAAVVRWNDDAGLELLVANDPDVRAAVGLFGRK